MWWVMLSVALKAGENQHSIAALITTLISFKNWPNPASFCLFSSFSTLHKSINCWKRRWCAWYLNSGCQDGRLWRHPWPYHLFIRKVKLALADQVAETWIWAFWMKNGPFRPLFLYFRLFNTAVHINFATDRIGTADLWCWKRPLYQLRHNDCQRSLICRVKKYLIRWRTSTLTF